MKMWIWGNKWITSNLTNYNKTNRHSIFQKINFGKVKIIYTTAFIKTKLLKTQWFRKFKKLIFLYSQQNRQIVYSFSRSFWT